MTLRVDKLLSGEENLLALVKYSFPDHAEKFSAETITVELVEEHGDAERNTRAVLTAIEGSGLSGSADVFYDRMVLADAAIELPDGELPVDVDQTEAALAEWFASITGLVDELTFTVAELAVDGKSSTCVVTANEGAVTVFGSAVVTFTVRPEEISELVGDGDLDGFDHSPVEQP